MSDSIFLFTLDSISEHFILSFVFSNDEAEQEEAELEPPAKRTRVHAEFVYDRSFNTKIEALALVKSMNLSGYYKSDSEAGESHLLRYNHVKFRGKQCAAKGYLLYDSKSTEIHFFKTVADHDHDQNVNAIYEIPEATKNEIKNMYDLGVTSRKRIINNLLLRKIELPNDRKLVTFLKELKTEKLGERNINLIDLKKWLEDNLIIPIDKTQPFVVNFTASLNEKKSRFQFFHFNQATLGLSNKSTSCTCRWHIQINVAGVSSNSNWYLRYASQFPSLWTRRLYK